MSSVLIDVIDSWQRDETVWPIYLQRNGGGGEIKSDVELRLRFRPLKLHQGERERNRKTGVSTGGDVGIGRRG